MTAREMMQRQWHELSALGSYGELELAPQHQGLCAQQRPESSMRIQRYLGSHGEECISDQAVASSP